jgi:hypothetical protein
MSAAKPLNNSLERGQTVRFACVQAAQLSR